MLKIKGTELYDIDELAKFLKVKSITIQRMLKRGRINGIKIGKKWYVSQANLDSYLSGISNEINDTAERLLTLLSFSFEGTSVKLGPANNSIVIAMKSKNMDIKGLEQAWNNSLKSSLDTFEKIH